MMRSPVDILFETNTKPSRFEVVLGLLQQMFDPELEILDLYQGGRPNQNHRNLRELARRGALIITTNFDMLIEKAFDETERYKLRVTDHEFERAAAENDNRISRDGRSLTCGHTRAYFSYPHGLAA